MTWPAFYVRTACGVSTTIFTTTTALLSILGVLQGSGAAPYIWMCLSNVLLQALSSLTDGFNACCPCGLLISQRPGKAFVDDTAQIQLQSVMWKPEQLEQQRMKRRAQVQLQSIMRKPEQLEQQGMKRHTQVQLQSMRKPEQQQQQRMKRRAQVQLQ